MPSSITAPPADAVPWIVSARLGDSMLTRTVEVYARRESEALLKGADELGADVSQCWVKEGRAS